MDIRLLSDHAYQGKYESYRAEPVCECDNCSEIIFEGDEFYLIGRNIMCEPCVMSCRRIAELYK